nr:hypothetical protein [Tanacetum cinerariifolium]
MQTQTSNTLYIAIMEAGSKDRPPMLTPGNYVQWKSRIKRYIDTKPNHDLIHYCLENPPYQLDWINIKVLVSEGSPITTTERICETYKNVSQDIRDQLNAEAKVVQIILTGIYNDIYSTVDACLNACEMWKAIERKFTSQDGESLESYYSRFYKMMNELIKNQCKVTNHQLNVQLLLQLQPEWQRAKKIARVANPLTLVAQQQPVYHSQHHPNQFTRNSLTRSQQAATRNRGKAIVNSPQPIYDQESHMVDEDDEMHVARECQKPKRVKDATYHREKMLLCKQEEAVIQMNVEQADWRDDTDDDELENQELEAHYMYMAQLQQVSPDATDSVPIFHDEPLQK